MRGCGWAKCGVSEAAEAFLQTFHSRNPGGSARAFGHGKDECGQSSYHRLAQTIAASNSKLTVVDLGCGDGYLLALLRERLGPSARLVGVDMSPDELRAARARVDSGVELRCERAQETRLAAGSVDAVVSHMALMLMAPLDAVIREMHRIVRPGGILAAVVGTDRRPAGAWAEFIAIVRELGAMPTMAIGDSRARTTAGIREVFGGHGTWTEIGIEDFDLNIDGIWPQVESYLFDTYVPELIDPRLRAPLRREVAKRIPPLADAHGIVPCRLGMRLLQFRRFDASIASAPTFAHS
jgi:SAM-dependent methyltransferase